MRSVHVGIRFDCARLIAAAVRSLADCCPGQRGCIALGRALTDSTSLGLLDLSATLETAPIGVVHTHTHPLTDSASVAYVSHCGGGRAQIRGSLS